MLSLLLVAICSLTIVLVLTPLFRDFFGFLGIVDRPDSERKNHSRPIPRVGGIALAVGYSGTMAAIALGWWFGGIHLASDPTIQLVVRLLPAVVIIFGTGLIDDVWGLPPKYKLAGQCVAASYACWIGVRLAAPSGNSGWTIVIDLVSIFWLVLCANAFNLIDGMDGLAAGIGLIAAVSLLMAAIIHHHPGLALAIAPLIGGLFGFLYYNFNPASIFLGDCGSLLVGFLLGCYGLLWNQKATTGLGGLAPLAALALPVLEVMLSIARRYLRTRPIFGADGNHIHHRMLGLGLSPRASTLVLYSVSATAALVAVLQTILRPQLMSVLFLMATALAYVGLRTLRYPEFGALSRFLFAGDFRRALRTRIYLQEYEESLA